MQLYECENSNIMHRELFAALWAIQRHISGLDYDRPLNLYVDKVAAIAAISNGSMRYIRNIVVLIFIQLYIRYCKWFCIINVMYIESENNPADAGTR